MKNDYHGWNTPTGLGIFFICVAISIVLLSIALLNLNRAEKVGSDIYTQMPMMQQWDKLNQ